MALALAGTCFAGLDVKAKGSDVKSMNLKFDNSSRASFDIVPQSPFSLKDLEKRCAKNRSLFELSKRSRAKLLGLIKVAEAYDIYIGEWAAPSDGAYAPSEMVRLQPTFIAVESLNKPVTQESEARKFLLNEIRFLADDEIEVRTNKKGTKLAIARSYPTGGAAVNAALAMGKRPIYFPDADWIDIDSVTIE